MWIFSFNFSFEFNNEASHVPLPCKCSIIQSYSKWLIRIDTHTYSQPYRTSANERVNAFIRVHKRAETHVSCIYKQNTHIHIAFVFAKWPYFKKRRQNNRCFNNWVCWVVEVKASSTSGILMSHPAIPRTRSFSVSLHVYVCARFFLFLILCETSSHRSIVHLISHFNFIPVSAE